MWPRASASIGELGYLAFLFFPLQLHLHHGAGSPAAAYREEIVVTATGEARPVNQVPYATRVIESAEIERQPARTAPEFLQDTPGIWIQKTAAAQAAPFVRGLVGNQVVHLIDGIRLNNATYRFGPNQYLALIDPFAVRQIEVVRGPMSVLYGSDALGGVVQMLTSPAAELPGGRDFSGRVTGQWGSADISSAGHAELALRTGGWRIEAGAVAQDIGDVRAGGGQISRSALSMSGRQPNTGYRSWGGELRVERVKDNYLFDLGIQSFSQQDSRRADAIASGRNTRWSLEPQRRELVFGRYQRSRDAWLSQLELTLSLQRIVDGSSEQRASSWLLTDDQFEDQQLGVQIQLGSRTFNAHHLTMGVDFLHDWIEAGRLETNVTNGSTHAVRPRYPDGSTMSTFAGYLQDDWEPIENLRLVMGARYSGVRVAPGSDPELGKVTQEFRDLSGSIGWLWTVGSGYQIVGGLGRGFRSPNIDDLSFVGQTGSGFEVPNPRLSPESLVQIDVGLRRSSPKARWEVRAYQSELRDLIIRTRSDYQGRPDFEGLPVFTRSNTGRARIRGAELSMDWYPARQWELASSAMWTRGDDLTQDVPLRRIPPGYMSFRVRRAVEGRHWWQVRLEAAAAQRRISPDDASDPRIGPNGTGGWWTVGWSGGYRPAELLEIQVFLQNIFDHFYRVHGSGIDAPGLSLGIRLSWNLH